MRVPVLALIGLAAACCGGAEPMNIPGDFPSFRVPGHEAEMQSVRELFWLHNDKNGPMATLWDQWMAAPSLWPALESTGFVENRRKAWYDTLSNRIVDKDGYVSTHQHPSIAHPLGWPFPFWNQAVGGMGWHFSFKNTIDANWRPHDLNTTDGWQLSGARDDGIDENGWNLTLTEPDAVITAPAHPVDAPLNAPFLQLRWKATGLGNAQPYVEWTTKDRGSVSGFPLRSNPETPATKDRNEFGPDRRFYFDPTDGDTIHYEPIPVYKHPAWKGEVEQLRIGFGNKAPGAKVCVQAFFTQYDTRHDINSQCYVRGCTTYFEWTRDINFLRRNMDRMRLALRFVMTEFDTLDRKYVYNTWIGHDGRSGLGFDKDGKKHILYGHGIGDNYWDLLPFGCKDFYATMLYYEALQCMARIERDIRQHPEWNVAISESAFDPDMLTKHAAEVKAEANKLFWNPKTGRFVPGIDADGKMHDYGMTFLNLEAIYYDFATPEHAKSILSWIDGERTVAGDTAQGADIYHWRFAPRATTKRNVEFYFWAWNIPEGVPWGGQVQDGGAVLGFSYHDMMARLAVLGPDSAAARLSEITKWFDEVQAAGGYRKYYNGSREGTCQGGGTAGGLGLDMEFVESVLVPQVMIDGFMGFKAFADGFAIDPKLPSDWPELTINRIHFHDSILTARATKSAVEVTNERHPEEPAVVRLPKGEWKASYIGAEGSPAKGKDGSYVVDWATCDGVRFERTEK